MNNDCLGESVIFLRTILYAYGRESRETHFFEPYLFSPTKQQPTYQNSNKDTGVATNTADSFSRLGITVTSISISFTDIFLSFYRI